MVLSVTQRGVILNVVDDLLDLAADKDKFLDEVQRLQIALKPNSQKIDSTFLGIRNCLLTPQTHFLRLEEMGNAITIEDVMLTILEAINYKIQELAKNHQLNVDKLWQPSEIFSCYKTNHNLKQQFKTNKHLLAAEHPLAEFPPITNAIYSREVHFNERFEETDGIIFPWLKISAQVKVSFRIPTGQRNFTKEIDYAEFQNIFASDGEEAAFFYGLRRNIENEALEFVKDKVLNHWEEKFNVKIVDDSEFPSQLITNATYFELVESEKISYTQLAVSNDQAELLLARGVNSLIKHDVCSLKDAKNLNATARMMIGHPVYYELLKDKAISFYNIQNMDAQRAAFLVFPIIANLIKQNKLSFNKAKNLPLALKTIFAMKPYADYFLRNGTQFDWTTFHFFTKKTYEFLEHPYITDLITNNILSFKDVASMSPERFQLATSKNIYLLLKSQALSKNAIFDVSHFLQIYLNKYPFIADWVECGAITLSNIKIYSVGTLSKLASVNRLLNIFKDMPYIINDETDYLNRFIEDIPQLAKSCKEDVNDFWNDILEKFLQEFTSYIAQQKTGYANVDFYYAQLIDLLKGDESEKTDPQKRMHAILSWAEDTLKELSKINYNGRSFLDTVYHTLFCTSKRQKILSQNFEWNQLQNICKSSHALKPILQALNYYQVEERASAGNPLRFPTA